MWKTVAAMTAALSLAGGCGYLTAVAFGQNDKEPTCNKTCSTLDK